MRSVGSPVYAHEATGTTSSTVLDDRGRTAQATCNLAWRHYSSRVPSFNGTESNCVEPWKKEFDGAR